VKAAVLSGPSSDIRFEERDRPAPGRGEVLIRLHACGVCHGDLMLQLGQFPFARYPIVSGHEIAGVIEEIGENVTELQPGARFGLSALF
jgi:alcohol dehydrogenase, propanol-preferring